jgi:hypothetical protein
MGAEQGRLQWNAKDVDCTSDTVEDIGLSAFQYECAESESVLRDRITLFHFALLLVLTLLMVRASLEATGKYLLLPCHTP